MQIENNTKYDTNDLRKIISLSMQKFKAGENGNSLIRKNYKIIFNTHKSSGWVGGCAYYHSNWLTIKLPLEYRRTELTFSQSVADVFFHEIGHCLGVKHNKDNDTIERYYRKWILETITPDFEIKEAVKVVKDKVDIQLYRYGLVSQNIKTAKTRLKRAKTIFDKWQRKLLYYENNLILAGKLPPKNFKASVNLERHLNNPSLSKDEFV